MGIFLMLAGIGLLTGVVGGAAGAAKRKRSRALPGPTHGGGNGANDGGGLSTANPQGFVL